jgi:hypothetical protein
VQGRKRPVAQKGDPQKGGAKRNAGAKRRARHRGRFGRKQIIIVLIAVVLFFDVGIMTFWFSKGGGASVPPNPDPYALIQGQMSNNRTIAVIGYDHALTFASYPDLTIVNTSSLKPISNNLLKRGAAADGSDVLYDEQIVGRVLKFNSDWVDYLNDGNRTALGSIQESSPAATKLAELGTDSQIAYHRLVIGEIRHIGKNYYIITRASYTLTGGGQLDIHDDIFVYKLVASQNTMLIVDFEQIFLDAMQQQQPIEEAGPVEGDENAIEAEEAEGVEGSEEVEGEGTAEGEETGSFEGEGTESEGSEEDAP